MSELTELQDIKRISLSNQEKILGLSVNLVNLSKMMQEIKDDFKSEDLVRKVNTLETEVKREIEQTRINNDKIITLQLEMSNQSASIQTFKTFVTVVISIIAALGSIAVYLK